MVYTDRMKQRSIQQHDVYKNRAMTSTAVPYPREPYQKDHNHGTSSIKDRTKQRSTLQNDITSKDRAKHRSELQPNIYKSCTRKDQYYICICKSTQEKIMTTAHCPHGPDKTEIDTTSRHLSGPCKDQCNGPTSSRAAYDNRRTLRQKALNKQQLP